MLMLSFAMLGFALFRLRASAAAASIEVHRSFFERVTSTGLVAPAWSMLGSAPRLRTDAGPAYLDASRLPAGATGARVVRQAPAHRAGIMGVLPGARIERRARGLREPWIWHGAPFGHGQGPAQTARVRAWYRDAQRRLIGGLQRDLRLAPSD